MSIGGVLLTGGASRRLGTPKATLVADGETLAARLARLLTTVCDRTVEVGPGFSALPAVREEPAGTGPLAALAAGAAALEVGGGPDAAIVLAVDLPLVDEPLLRWLAGHHATESIVPVVEGRAQPLCARYSREALGVASELVDRGERSMHALLDAIDVRYADESEWGTVCDASVFLDVDTPEDVTRAGLVLPADPPGSEPSGSR